MSFSNVKGHAIFSLAVAIILSTAIYSEAQQFLEYDNGVLHLKLDLIRGGAIAYISTTGSTRNLVNIADEGRYIQQSYYAGKAVNRQAEGQSPSWSPWSWNPIQVGDYAGNRAKILASAKTGDTLYVKCTPMLWDMNNKPAEAEMEQWTILKANVLQVRCKLTCHRTDNIYGEGISNDQELPATYPISALSKLYSYFGAAPFTNATTNNPTVVNLSSGFWGRYTATENWMAFVDNTNWGMGVYNPTCTSFLAGMAGSPGGETTDGSTCYIAPVKKEILNKTSVYEYNYYVIIGAVSDIRSKVYALHSGATVSRSPHAAGIVTAKALALTLDNDRIVFHIACQGAYALRVFDAAGNTHAIYHGNDQGSFMLQRAMLSRGVYFAQLTSASGSVIKEIAAF